MAVQQSQFEVFNKWTYLTLTELVDQQVQLFNEASANTIIMKSAANTGDYNDAAFWKKVSGLVKRRNAYADETTTVAAKQLEHLLDTSVKVAAGTPELQIPPGQFDWIQRSPEEAGVVIAQQLAGDMLQDMLNVSISATYAALSQASDLIHDGTAGTMDPSGLISGAALFGDRYGAIKAWVLHSKVMHDLWKDNALNAETLFKYESIAITADPFGRRFIVTDSDSLITTGSPDEYHTLGLVAGATTVEQNSDYYQTIVEETGSENIQRNMQAQWSYNLGVKGFAWDKTNGGASPTSAALGTATNWDQYATYDKDLAGVIVNTD